jgi:phenylalanyl-tRNA synthetase beta chain
MIKEICGGEIASDVVDVYPHPKAKAQVALRYHYLKKLSGKNYHPDTVKEILGVLGFDIIKEGIDELVVAAPLHKPDISLPADVVEEIIRIDGLDNIQIPASITMTPSIEQNFASETFREKCANYLVGLGFNEIMTNSITNQAHFDEIELQEAVVMLNSLSADLNIMRPSMLETGLQAIAYNLNRKNNDLRFFDFGKTYTKQGTGKYFETEHLCLYITGNLHDESWRNKSGHADFYYLKGVINALLQILGSKPDAFEIFSHKKLSPALQVRINGSVMIQFGGVSNSMLNRFDIKQPVFFADINWNALRVQAEHNEIKIEDAPKFPLVSRDIAMIVDRGLKYEEAERAVQKLKLAQLSQVRLFDVFESDKLGADKKSMAINFTFMDKDKTLTEQEIDDMMKKIMTGLERDLNAEIRK